MLRETSSHTVGDQEMPWGRRAMPMGDREMHLIEYYNFNVDFICIRDCQPSQIQSEDLYLILGHINHLKLKSFQLQVFRSL